MKRFRLIAPCLFISMFAGLPPTPARRHPTSQVSLASIRESGDQHYKEGSFALAAQEYGQWLKRTPASGGDRTEVEYRWMLSLGQAQRWDAAFASSNDFLYKHHSEPLWTARAEYWRGLLLQKVPHYGYRVGKRIYRGDNYPHVAGAVAPQEVDLEDEDDERALDAFERAVQVFETLPASTRKAHVGEESDLSFDLAQFLPEAQPWGLLAEWRSAGRMDWRIDPTVPYNPSWPSPKKSLYLLGRIPLLPGVNPHTALLARVALALFVRANRDSWARRAPDGSGKILQSLPYRQWDSTQLLRQAADQYPNDPLTPQVRLMAANGTMQSGNLASALAQDRQFLNRYGHTAWAGDAQAAIGGILQQSVSLSTPGPQPAGQPAVVNVSVHNLKKLIFRAYQIPLPALLTDPTRLYNPHFSFFNFPFSSIRAAASKGAVAAEWTYSTGDTGNYRPLFETMRTPLRTSGAYLVEATGDSGRVRSATLVLISDLAVIQKGEHDGTLLFVADARTGQPVPGARVIVRDTQQPNYYRKPTAKQRAQVVVSQGVTDAEGIYHATHTPISETYSSEVETFASAAGNRYALTNPQGHFWAGRDFSPEGLIQVYAYTDRPVYRPTATVYFRELLARRVAGGRFVPLVGAKATVKVLNSHNELFYTTKLTSSVYGTINGSFPLPAGAPLGEYSLQVSLSAGTGDISDEGSSRFRVEEYKKPEFQVSVTPTTQQARFGDTVTANVKATYYFGAPVAHAKAVYKVFRSPFEVSYQFPQPYEWLLRYYQNGGYMAGYMADYSEQGELVAQGQIFTDAAGNASIHFPAKRGARDYTGDYSYTIDVAIVDASRRQVSGEGTLKVTNQQFYAYLKAARGFYVAGDKAQIELRTQDANDNPVAATGTLTVYRLLYRATGKETRMTVHAERVNAYPSAPDDEIHIPVHTEQVTTDANGRAFITWPAEMSGRYRVEFSTRDRFNTKVTGATTLWVGGEPMQAGTFRSGGITLVTDKTTYEEGEMAHVLVVADKPGAWVLLTGESGNQILNHSLVHVVGQTTTVDVPITRAHVPNFALAAAAVQDYKFYAWQQAIFVPPARQFLHVDVTGDKAEYRPGETGHFQIKAMDWAGQPVATEVSLGVVDSSLFYIQSEYAPDVRLFFYGEQRSLTVYANSSQEFRPSSRTESDLRLPAYRIHGIHLPDVGRLFPGNFTGLASDLSMPYPFMAGLLRPLFSSSVSTTTTTTSINATATLTPPTPTQFAKRASGGPMTGAGMADMAMPSLAHSARMPKTVEGADESPASAALRPSTILGGEHEAFVPARLRKDFADTAFWTPAVVTSAKDGQATVDVKFPDSLTTWKASALGLTQGMQVGSGTAQVITDKRLLVRLEAPRFFVERDRVVLSAIVRNDLKTEKQVRVSLQTDASTLTSPAGAQTTITIPSGGEKRIDWPCRVTGSGLARVRMTAETDEESDAVEQSFPALVHGVQKFVGGNGVLAPNATATHFNVTIPAAHKPGSSALLVQVNPSLAATALDALPYLADYPYGCVEQTMSRFLPSVVVARTLRAAGVNLDTLRQRAALHRQRETNGTAFGAKLAANRDTDASGYTYPNGTPGVLKAADLGAELDHGDRWKNPVFDAARLKGMVDEGLARLVSMQRQDGGWGWWPDSSESDPYMTGYVVYGLATARAAGVPLPGRMLERGYAYLMADIKNRFDQRDLAAWEAFALSQRGAPLPPTALRVLSGVYAERGKLSPYAQALLALTLHNQGQDDRAKVLIRNLLNTATIDRQNGTASWKSPYGSRWNWYNNDVETTAWILKAYTAIQPRSELGPMLVRWLVTRLRGTAWSSTKETAIAVYALADYIRVNRELDPQMTVTVALGSRIRRTFHIDRDNALLFDNRFLVPDALLPAGTGTVTISRTGAGRLYYTSALQYFTTEAHIRGVGGLLKVQRRYFRLTPKTVTSAAPEGGTYRALDYTRTALPDGAAIRSGDLLEAELVMDAANDFDYVVLEDMKPAGCEPVDLRSGARYGNGLCSDMELRDTKTAFFIDRLPQGTHAIRYRLRAEVPGLFHALPTNAYAMYAPDVRALSDEWEVTVGEAR